MVSEFKNIEALVPYSFALLSAEFFIKADASKILVIDKIQGKSIVACEFTNITAELSCILSFTDHSIFLMFRTFPRLFLGMAIVICLYNSFHSCFSDETSWNIHQIFTYHIFKECNCNIMMSEFKEHRSIGFTTNLHFYQHYEQIFLQIWKQNYLILVDKHSSVRCHF